MTFTKKISVVAALTFGLAASASAADLSTPVFKAPPPAAPIFTWTGFYIGGQVGAGWGTSQTNVDVGNTFVGAPVNQTVNQLLAGALGLSVPLPQVQMNGFLGGGQVGYNYQAGGIVVGLEGDILGAGLKGTTGCVLVLNCTNKIDWIADITGRVGVTVGDRGLIYIKGGAAWAGANVGINQSASVTTTLLGGVTANGSISGSASKDVFGGTLGAGVEYAFMPGWSAKIEYDYYDFGSQNTTVPITASGGITAPIVAAGSIGLRVPVSITEQIHTVRAGVNYHF